MVRIGKYCTVSKDVKFGKNVTVHGHVNLYGCRIGDDCSIGAFVEIQRDACVGKRVRIQSHTFICSNITIEDDCFIGHHVCFINDRYPTSAKAKAKTWKCEGSTIRRGASIGSGAVILCGVEVGEGAVVGAGSVVVEDVPPHAVIAGVPARVLRSLTSAERWLGGQPKD
ncbi:MAG: acyltransferase [Candidatus Omnitrophica bacterium]|nr:acyltransferase [Candidatus Omnitrophota bacterium]MDD5237452.1 acyltransferase [Candidatus Omnitrophota bacterium]